MSHRQRAGTVLAAATLAAVALWPASAVADQQRVTNPMGNPNRAISARARLDFVINMGKFLFFRVGTGAFPSASGAIDAVSFITQPTIPPGATALVNGSGMAVTWNGAPPVFSVAASNNVLPVEVRSNAGQVTLRATATTPLSSGANSIALSQIILTSSDGVNLPAPLIPDTGTGASVNVTGTAFANLVTVRGANWTFGYANTVAAPAGVYTGQVTFTASAP